MFLIQLRRRPGHDSQDFPWSLPLVRGLEQLEFHRARDLPGGPRRYGEIHPAGRHRRRGGCGGGRCGGISAPTPPWRLRAVSPLVSCSPAAGTRARGCSCARRTCSASPPGYGESMEEGGKREAAALAASLPEGYGRRIAVGAVGRGQRGALVGGAMAANPDGGVASRDLPGLAAAAAWRRTASICWTSRRRRSRPAASWR